MFDDLDYRYAIMGIITDKRKKVMSELRVEIFVAAAQSSNAEACLMPFPPCFYDAKEKKKDFDLLLHHVRLFPPLSNLTEDADLPNLTWELLYWILTNPLNIEHVESSVKTLKEWEAETGRRPLLNLLKPSNSSSKLFLFKVNNPYPKQAFVDGKNKHGSFFGFHGSKFENYHSIIHRGLLSALNKRSAYGIGSYLASCYKYSSGYTETVPAWSGSAFDGMLHCVSICEIVDDPSIVKVPSGVAYVVQKDELIQLSHILLNVSPRLPHPDETFDSVLQRFRN